MTETVEEDVWLDGRYTRIHRTRYLTPFRAAVWKLERADRARNESRADTVRLLLAAGVEYTVAALEDEGGVAALLAALGGLRWFYMRGPVVSGYRGISESQAIAEVAA